MCVITGLPTLTHFTPISRSHADMLISHAQFLYIFFFACQRLVMMYEGCLYYVPAKSRQKFWDRKKKCWSPPPAHQLFWDLRDFIGWQRSEKKVSEIPPPPPPPAHQLFLGLARLYRLAADGRRMSHSEPSSNVGSPGNNTWACVRSALLFVLRVLFVNVFSRTLTKGSNSWKWHFS